MQARCNKCLGGRCFLCLRSGRNTCTAAGESGPLSAVGLVPLHRFAKVTVGIGCCSGFFVCIVAALSEVVGRLQHCASTWNCPGISLGTPRAKHVGFYKRQVAEGWVGTYGAARANQNMNTGHRWEKCLMQPVRRQLNSNAASGHAWRLVVLLLERGHEIADSHHRKRLSF